MEWNGCLSILQGYLENSPLIVLGSGASMPYGLPSMGTLAEEIKKLAEHYFNALEAFADANAFTEFSSKIDEILVKFLDNPKDKEDEIPWNESSFIDDTYETIDEYDDK